jgi:NAD(P)-dependent dehydrogenase (short-subunit alcohol dehydrogenase family)
MSLKDKNVVVTGGSRGLGLGLVEQFLARFGVPMPPREFGEKVASVLDDPKYADGFAFGLKGDTGVTMLEGAAA